MSITLSVTPLYAVLLTFIFLVLSVRVIQARRSQKFAYGSGEGSDNEALIRAQRNWAEYVPIALLLLLMAELQEISVIWLHICGLILLVGRALHGYGMGFHRKFFMGRVAGTGLTLLALIVLGLSNLVALF